MKKFDLTIIYYTANHLEKENPVFANNVKKQLIRAIGDYPLIIVSQKYFPVDDILAQKQGDPPLNVCVGDIGRSHLNIYKQIMIGCQHAKTKYVAMAEDDILYSYEHFHTKVPDKDVFLYDMNKLSLFTWTKPPLFSFRHSRMVVNQLIAPRKMLQEAMEERFARREELNKKGIKDEKFLKYWGDPGRYEKHLGVTVRERDNFMCTCPSIVFTHELAFGYLSRGKRKRLGDLRIIEVPFWGKAEDVLKYYYEERPLPER